MGAASERRPFFFFVCGGLISSSRLFFFPRVAVRVVNCVRVLCHTYERGLLIVVIRRWMRRNSAGKLHTTSRPTLFDRRPVTQCWFRLESGLQMFRGCLATFEAMRALSHFGHMRTFEKAALSWLRERSRIFEDDVSPSCQALCSVRGGYLSWMLRVVSAATSVKSRQQNVVGDEPGRVEKCEIAPPSPLGRRPVPAYLEQSNMWRQ